MEKLQAQRKFAQGAYVPCTNNNLTERRSREEVRNEPKQIYYNNMSANSLLDILSFQNVHRHNQPVVLLERLEETSGNQQLQDKTKMTLRKRKSSNLNTHKIKKTRCQSPQFTKDDEKPLKFFKTKHTRSNDHQTTGADGIHADSHYLRRNTNRSEARFNASTSKTAHILSTKRKRGRFNASTSKPTRVLSTKRKHEPISSSKKIHLGKRQLSKCPDNSMLPAKQERTIPKDRNNRSSETDVGVKIHNLRRNTTRSEVIKKSKAKKSSLNHSINKNSESNNLLQNNTNTELEACNAKRNTNRSKVLKKSKMPLPNQNNRTTSEHGVTLAPDQTLPDAHESLHDAETLIIETNDNDYTISRELPNIISIDNFYYGPDAINEWMLNAETSSTSKEPDNLIVPSPPEQICEQQNVEQPAHIQEPFEHNNEQYDNDWQIQNHNHKESILEIQDIEQPSRPQLNTVEQFTTPHICPPRNIRQPVVTEHSGGSSRLQGRLRLSAPSPCPSESLSTLREVLQAPRVTLDNRCRNCKHCQRINKVFKITNLMQRTRDPVDRARVAYETDPSSEITISTTPTQRTHTQTLKTMYLDLLPNDNGHIIEISTVKVDNRTEPIIQAKLINKSQVDNTQDLNLVEHENLFDQVLQTLKMSLLVSATSGSQQTVETVNETSDSIRNVGNTALPSNDGRPVLPDQPEAHCSHTNTQPITRISREKSSQSRKSADSLPKCQKSSFPKKAEGAKCVDAPIFYPTETEFSDPITYFEKIMPKAAKFGLCKVVAPAGFKPTCYLGEKIKFTVTNQYIARLYSRWGPAAREMSAIKAYLATQGVKFTRPPLLDGVEVNLAKLYHIVQRYGGLKNVIEKKRWTKVAEELGLTKGTNPEKKLDQIYVRYLLPYDTLSNQERQQTMSDVEKCWNKKNNKMLDRALNPLHRQKILLGESDSSEDESEEESEIAGALAEAEDCVVPGRSMNLVTFKKAASNVMDTHILTSSSTVTPATVEDIYWRHVLLGTEHVCVNTASIDTGEEGYGFTKNKSDPYGKHPWNLKMLSHNSGNVLRSLGAVLGVTAPTLHLGMVFSTSCWHRDPHGLPWVEYMHTGPGKIWYGIPNEESQNFRQAVETLCPAHCQNKQIWLSSDIIMVPPSLMMEQNVSLSRVIQNPGEFVIVFPKAYSSSICTGYTISESVYFATKSWLNTVTQDFQEVRDSCEPTMFSLEQLLIAAGRDTRASLAVVQQVHSVLTTIINNELKNRRALERLGIQSRPRKLPKKRSTGSWNVREQDECEFCRATLYLSKVIGLPDKKSSVCLHHALRLLETPKHKDRDLSSLALTCSYTDAELQDIINAVQKRLFP